MSLNIQNIKLDLIKWLANLDDESLLQKIIDLRKSEYKDCTENLSEKELDSINKGLADAINGRTKSHSEVKKLYEKWL